jgi:hypothetical protein
VLRRWVDLLKPGAFVNGRGLLDTGAGLHAEEILQILPDSLNNVVVKSLSNQTDLWGGSVPDERYMITTDRIKTEI